MRKESDLGQEAPATGTLARAATPAAARNVLLEVRLLRRCIGDLEILHGIDLAVLAGERLCIVGSSGAGKTSLLRCLSLLDEPTEGEVLFRGDVVGSWSRQGPSTRPSRNRLQRYRAKVAVVFQQFELFPHLTAAANISLGPRRVLKAKPEVAAARSDELLRRMGLAGYGKAYPHELSGGQQQRVAIARALAMDPDVILFDEPTSSLDSELVGEVVSVLNQVAADGTTIVTVTHALGFARAVADRLVVLDKGVVVEQGSPDAIIRDPQHARTEAFVRSHLEIR